MTRCLAAKAQRWAWALEGVQGWASRDLISSFKAVSFRWLALCVQRLAGKGLAGSGIPVFVGEVLHELSKETSQSAC